MTLLDSFELTVFVPAPPERVYAAWIIGDLHSKLTGAAAESEPQVGGRFTAWDGYIEGTHVELQAPARIVQLWRTSDFAAEAADSRLEVELHPEGAGTRLTLRHSALPPGDGARYAQGWRDFYFAPMTAFFA